MKLLNYTPPLQLIYKPQPKTLQITYEPKSNLEYEYWQLCQGKTHQGNNKTKKRLKKIDDKRQQDLFALLHWREYAEQQKRNEEAKKKYYKPKDEEKPNLKKAIFVFDIKKDHIQKLARFHYFIEFLIILFIDFIYLKTFGFNFTKLVLLIPLALLTVITSIYLIINLINIFRVMSHYDMVELFKYVILRMGEPGSGKSSSGIYDALILAEKLWKKLKFEFWCIKNRIAKIYSGTHLEHKVVGLDENKMPIVEYTRIYTGNKDKIKHAVEVVEAYEYYSEHKCIPCLWGDIPIFKNGVACSKFTADHLLQKRRVLYLGVAFLDEIGSMLPPELSNSKIRAIDLMFRFTRQYKEFRIISTEQDGKATLISARRVTAENKRMLQQKHILKPIVLNWLSSLLETKFVSKEPTDRKVNFITNLKTYVNNVGFRKFKYSDYGNLQVGNKGGSGSKTKSFLAPPSLNCEYDDRTFKNLYECKDDAPNVEQFESLVLSEEEVRELFNEEIINRAYKKDNKAKKCA